MDRDLIHRILSAVVCLGCLAFAHRAEGSAGVLSVVYWIVWPMALIWFSDAMGSATGFSLAHPVSKTTPGGMIRFTGWLFLVLLTGFILVHFKAEIVAQ